MVRFPNKLIYPLFVAGHFFADLCPTFRIPQTDLNNMSQLIYIYIYYIHDTRKYAVDKK